MEFPFVKCEMLGRGHKWRKASVTLRPRLAPILFSRQVQPAYICLPSRNGQGGRICTCVLLVPNLWPRANARLLLTLHPENGTRGRSPTFISGVRSAALYG